MFSFLNNTVKNKSSHLHQEPCLVECLLTRIRPCVSLYGVSLGLCCIRHSTALIYLRVKGTYVKTRLTVGCFHIDEHPQWECWRKPICRHAPTLSKTRIEFSGRTLFTLTQKLINWWNIERTSESVLGFSQFCLHWVWQWTVHRRQKTGSPGDRSWENFKTRKSTCRLKQKNTPLGHWSFGSMLVDLKR